MTTQLFALLKTVLKFFDFSTNALTDLCISVGTSLTDCCFQSLCFTGVPGLFFLLEVICRISQTSPHAIFIVEEVRRSGNCYFIVIWICINDMHKQVCINAS